MSATESSTDTILIETRGRVGLITLNRPEALNALNATLMREVVAAAEAFDADRGIAAIVLTGSSRAFAAGADIREMVDHRYADLVLDDWISHWDRLSGIRKPLIAAVAGFALGGGCEIAMLCDLIIAADTARFGQPEINLGVIPGIGGSQRLTRAIGKAKAMDMILTGRTMDAAEAERTGLVARVVAADALLDETLAIAQTIAAKSLPALLAAKETVNRAFETPLSEGIRFERRAFQALFALEDQTEGMTAFLQKREPEFKNR